MVKLFTPDTFTVVADTMKAFGLIIPGTDKEHSLQVLVRDTLEFSRKESLLTKRTSREYISETKTAKFSSIRLCHKDNPKILRKNKWSGNNKSLIHLCSFP